MSRGETFQRGFVLVFLFTVMLFFSLPVIAATNVVGASWTVGEDTTLTRLGDAVGKSPADFSNIYPWSEMKLCNVADNGIITAYIGQPGFQRDGSTGQVMVKIPKFYYQHTYDGVKHEFWVADGPTTDFKLHPAFIRNGVEVPYVLVGAYEAGISEDNKLTSNSGEVITFNKTRDQFRQLAQARGAGWNQIDIQTLSAIQLLYLVEYADTDCQEAIGAGRVNVGWVEGPINTGGCDSLKGASGAVGDAVSYRGIENLWGNSFLFIDGINIKNDEQQPYIADYDFADDKFDDNYQATGIVLPNSRDYCKDLACSPNADWLLMPSEVGGSANTYIPDVFYQDWDNALDKVVTFGGHWNIGVSRSSVNS